MNTYALQRHILQADLTLAEKAVGMTLALHLNIETGQIRVRQAVVAQECVCSQIMVRKTVKKMVVAGVFESKRTGRSLVLTLPRRGTVKNTVIVDRYPDIDLMDMTVSIREESEPRLPWDYDLTYSTKCEEEYKRALFQDASQGQQI